MKSISWFWFYTSLCVLAILAFLGGYNYLESRGPAIYEVKQDVAGLRVFGRGPDNDGHLTVSISNITTGTLICKLYVTNGPTPCFFSEIQPGVSVQTLIPLSSSVQGRVIQVSKPYYGDVGAAAITHQFLGYRGRLEKERK